MIDVGHRVPTSELPDTGGATVEIGGRGPATLLVFLPAAFTPLCGDEAAALTQIAPELEGMGARMLAISCDSMFTLQAWSEQLAPAGHRLRLLSDFWPHGAVARAYGAFDEVRGIATRSSFLLDGHGVVRWSTRSAPGQARDMAEHRAAVETLTAD